MNSSPNILILMSDEQRPDTLGCYGNPVARTPNLDRLAESGTRFDRAYTPYPLCCPARASLWTGRMPHRHGVLGNWRAIRPELADGDLIRPFLSHGYHTLYTGKWHVPGTTPARMGFKFANAIPAVLKGRDRGRYIQAYRDYAAALGYPLIPGHIENLTENDRQKLKQPGKAPCGAADIPLEHYLETWQTGQFLDALAIRPKDRPFFAVCSYNAPHFPMIVPRPYDTLLSPEEVILPPNFLAGIAGKPAEVLNSHYYRAGAGLDEAEWRRWIAHYWGFCALIDAQVGRILAYLEQEGLNENTIIVYTSDHGDMIGSHGLVEKGHLMHYEEDLGIPLIIRHPQQQPVRSFGGFVSLMDLLPTLADLAGVGGMPEGIDGQSLAGLWQTPENVSGREVLIAETYKFHDEVGNGGEAGAHGEAVDLEQFDPACDSANFSVRTREYQYVFRWQDVDELYDLQQDPLENVNLAGDHGQMVLIGEFQQMILAHLQPHAPRFAQLLASRIAEG